MKNLILFLVFVTFACSTDKPISDLTAPVITLIGDNPQILNLNDNYVELGATAADEIDGNITNQINITSSLNTSKEGNYIITYSVSDKAGNTTTINREVIVKYLNPIYLDSNGITVKAHDWAEVGMVGTLNGKQYKIVDRKMLQTMLSNNNNLSAICTTKIKDMSGIFALNRNFTQDIKHWDVSNVTTMANMFYLAKNFNQDIGNWDVRNVTNMYYMFNGATTFNQNIGNWNVGKLTNTASMFYDALSFNQDIGNWNVRNVKDMAFMFYNANAFNQNIGNWNVSSVTDMIYMFSNTPVFNQDIGNWNVSNVKKMTGMFYNARIFNQDISNWDVKNVTDMSDMFTYARLFNQNIGNWDVSNVINMDNMFYAAEKFNQDLSRWCVKNITKKPYEFDSYSNLTSQNYPKWGTCPN